MTKRTTNHTVEEKESAVKSVLDYTHSVSSTAKNYGIQKSTLKNWIRKYKAHGTEGLKERKTETQYSKAQKVEAVKYYLETDASQADTCEVFNLSSRSVLRRWIKAYTSGKELQSTGKGCRQMKHGRKTTWEERIEITQYAIDQDKDYTAAADKYGVSYTQVYQWVQKYEALGTEGLKDRRGKGLETKPNPTQEEAYQIRIKELEERAAYLETENRLLKKLKELKRRHDQRE